MVDDLRRIVADEVYETERNWFNLLQTDLELCRLILNNNNDHF